MFYACFGGQAYTLKVMLNELQCNGQSVDAYGRTPLHCAAFAGFAACIEVLLDTQVGFGRIVALIWQTINKAYFKQFFQCK